jgi:hypothetical protein
LQLDRADQADAVAEFLRAELDSERFGPALRAALAGAGADETLVTKADLADPAANALRHDVLFAYRGDYLGAWFDELTWYRAVLEPEEVLAILYIDWDFWLDVSGGSRRPIDAVPRLRAQGEEQSYRALAERSDHPPLIVVRAAEGERLVVVEGHVRLTAYAFCPELLPAQLEVVLGEGPAVTGWGCY